MTVSSTLSTKIANAWLLIGPTDQRNPYSLSIRSTAENVSPGDGTVFAYKSGATTKVFGFGRVYRIRRMSSGATVYLDRVKYLADVSLTDLGIDYSEVDETIKRLDWPVFASALQSATQLDFTDLPAIVGTTQEEKAYLRELLRLATVDDLLGPACGPDEEIIGMSVRDRYLVGKLAPRVGGHAGESIEGLQGPMAEEARPGQIPTDLKPFEEQGAGKEKAARRRLPGEEFSPVGGSSDPDDDDSSSIDASKNQSFVPSSMGLTVCVDGAVEDLLIDVHWGRYTRTASEKEFDDKGKPLRAWKRIPAGGRISIRLIDGLIKPIAPDASCPQVIIQGTVRPPLPSGGRLVTIFLVNNQAELDRNQDEAWLFQPEIILNNSDRNPIFHRRPVVDSTGSDHERDALEMVYRKHMEYGVGHCVSVHAVPSNEDLSRASEIRTSVLPHYEVPITETPGVDPQDRPAMRRMVTDGFLDMQTLAELDRADLIQALSILTADYEAWIEEQRKRIGKDVLQFDVPADKALARCEQILDRLKEGIETIQADDNAFQAFKFANRAMAMQRIRSIFSLRRRRKEEIELNELDVRKNRSWRPFQLAFILLSIPALANPLHRDRTKPIDAFADLLWFPTGGGKTEAYLGVAAFAMAIRRLHGDIGGYDGSRGLAVIMRYTLRLLTLQQFQRAATLICAMESIRRLNEKVWGTSPFTLGLWVGQKVTPNDTEESHEAIEAKRTNKRPTRSSPAQLTSCPWCGSEIAPGRDIEVRRCNNDVGRTLIFCGDKFGRCDFSRTKSRDSGIPVIVVDDELYRRPPSMLIATVDKFAMMAWRGQVRTLFGIASRECKRHGLLWDGADCNGKHASLGSLPVATELKIKRLRPPDLIIQDEFHLISGPLGTMVGLYETAVDELSTWGLDGKAIRPKVIASSATVRKASEQMNNVFLRRVAIFPPHGLDIEDNFFAVQRSTRDKPGRLYMGICSPGSARPAVLIRVYTALLTAAQSLLEHFGPSADPWMTLVGYFNSLRELGGMRRLAEDDVQTRSYRVQMSDVVRPGLAQRNVKNVDELTSRVQSKDIPAKLDQLEIGFTADLEPNGSYKVRWNKGEIQPIDVVLATNMLSVGVDVNRLGLMVVNGQPKSTAEYIQATSRVGRSFPGFVCTVLTWSRPRDLSHYESFEHYHATFYKHVEAQSATPFAPRALDRGLTGTMVSWLRLSRDAYNPNLGASTMSSPTTPEVAETKRILGDRGWRVVGQKSAYSLTEAMVGERLDEWIKEATRGGRRLGYEAGRSKGQGDVAGLLKKPGVQAWDHFTAPMSLREVEADVRLVMSSDHLPEGPAWKPRTSTDKVDK